MHAIYTSPLERAVETANLIGEPHRLSPVIRADLGELRFGEWEGRTFEELSHDSRWVRFNTARSIVCPPGGELMIEAQARMVREIESLVEPHQNETVGVVTHLDPLRGLIAHCLGIPLDLMLRFQIDPASVSVVRFFESAPQILCVNCTSELPI
jgi:probable phosphoglycerate mutase